MPCLFLENVPNVQWSPGLLGAFHTRAAQILEGYPIEVHLRDVRYILLTADGAVPGDNHGVHGFIHWHEGRTPDQVESLGEAIQKLLDDHGIGEGFDLTFIEGPKGRSFYFMRELVP